MTYKEITDKILTLVKEAQRINDLATGEKREMAAEESEKFDKIMAEVDELDAQRNKLVEGEKRAAWLKSQSEPTGRKTSPTEPKPTVAAISDDEKREMVWGEKYSNGERRVQLDGPLASDEYRDTYNRWMCGGFNNLSGDEVRALQADSDTAGGYLQAPLQMAAGLLKFVDNLVWVRQKASVYSVNGAKSLGVVSLENDPADFNWTTELATGSEDSTMSFGKRELTPHPLAKLIKVSNTLLRVGVMSADSLVQSRLGYKVAVTEEAAFMTGTGVQQPLGMFTASSLGISTSRDVSTGNTTTSIQTDGLIEAKYGVKGQYQATGEWVLHRDAVKQIRKLKDGNGQYLWQPGIGGTPNTILDRPVNISEYAPNTFTTGLYVGLFGDLKFYWIADNLSLQIQRLVELYAATNQTGFIGRVETDGMPVLEEAFSRVKLA